MRKAFRIFGTEREKVAGSWLVNSRRMRWTRHVESMREMRHTYRVLVRILAERPQRRTRLRREYNNKMNLKEVECEGMDWIKLV